MGNKIEYAHPSEFMPPKNGHQLSSELNTLAQTIQKNREAFVRVPHNRTPDNFRSTLFDAMTRRGLKIHTSVSNDRKIVRLFLPS